MDVQKAKDVSSYCIKDRIECNSGHLKDLFNLHLSAQAHLPQQAELRLRFVAGNLDHNRIVVRRMLHRDPARHLHSPSSMPLSSMDTRNFKKRYCGRQ